MKRMSGRSTMSEMFGKTYIVKVLDDGECITEGELIRCKDCKHHRDDTRCNNRIGVWFDDDYCSGAERKDNER